MRVYRFIAAAMPCFAAAFMSSCAPPRPLLRPSDVAQRGNEKIARMTMTSGEVIKFDFNGGRYYAKHKNKTRVIVGKTIKGIAVELDLDRVLRIYTVRDWEEERLHRSVFPAFFILAFLVAATSQSSS